MAYKARTWINKNSNGTIPSGAIPMSAENLNVMENAIETISKETENSIKNISDAVNTSKNNTIQALNSVINDFNFSLAACNRDTNGAVIYQSKKISSGGSYQWNDDGVEMESKSYNYMKHDIGDFYFKLNLSGMQPEIKLTVNVTSSLSHNLSTSYITANSQNTAVYELDDKGNKVYICSCGSNVLISDTSVIEHLIKDNPKLYLEASYYYYNGYSRKETLNGTVTYTVTNVSCTVADRTKLSNITS